MTNATAAPIAPLVYLKRELNFKMSEWSGLSDQDKQDLKNWAVEEMTAQGIPVKA